MSDKEYNKFNSRRWRVATWAMVNITLFLGWAMIIQVVPAWFATVMPILGAIPSIYIGAESYTKTHLK